MYQSPLRLAPDQRIAAGNLRAGGLADRSVASPPPNFQSILLGAAAPVGLDTGADRSADGAGSLQDPSGDTRSHAATDSADPASPDESQHTEPDRDDAKLPESDDAEHECDAQNRRLINGAALAIPMTIQSLNTVLLSGGATMRAKAALREEVGDPVQPIRDNPSKSDKRGQRSASGDDHDEQSTDPDAHRAQDRSRARTDHADLNALTASKPSSPGDPDVAYREQRASSAQPPASNSRSDAQQRSASIDSAPAKSALAAANPAADNARAALRRLESIGIRPADATASKPDSTAAPRLDASGPAKAADPIGAIAAGRPAQRTSSASGARAEAVSIQMMRSVAAGAQRAAAHAASEGQTDSAILNLRPEALGPVKVRVDVRDGVVSASFESGNDMAHDLLKSSVADLRQQLESRGITVDRLDVNLRETPPSTVAKQTEPPAPHIDQRTHASPSTNDASPNGTNDTDGRGSFERDASQHNAEHPGDDRTRQHTLKQPPSEHGDSDHDERAAWMPMDGLIDALA